MKIFVFLQKKINKIKFTPSLPPVSYFSHTAQCDMFSPPKHHMTKTTQESKSPDKHRHGCECNAAFTIAVRIYIILKLYILYGHVFIAPALEVRGEWKAKHRRMSSVLTFQCEFEWQIRSKQSPWK